MTINADSSVQEQLPPGWERRWDDEVGDFYTDHNTWTTYLPEELMDYFAERVQCERLMQIFREDMRRCVTHSNTLLRAMQRPNLPPEETARLQRQATRFENAVELKNRTIEAIERKFDDWVKVDAERQRDRSSVYAKLQHERIQYELLFAESQEMQQHYEKLLADYVSIKRRQGRTTRAKSDAHCAHHASAFRLTSFFLGLPYIHSRLPLVSLLYVFAHPLSQPSDRPQRKR